MGYRDNDTTRKGRGRDWRRKNHIAKDLRKKEFQQQIKPADVYKREKINIKKVEENEN